MFIQATPGRRAEDHDTVPGSTTGTTSRVRAATSPAASGQTASRTSCARRTRRSNPGSRRRIVNPRAADRTGHPTGSERASPRVDARGARHRPFRTSSRSLRSAVRRRSSRTPPARRISPAGRPSETSARHAMLHPPRNPGARAGRIASGNSSARSSSCRRAWARARCGKSAGSVCRGASRASSPDAAAASRSRSRPASVRARRAASASASASSAAASQERRCGLARTGSRVFGAAASAWRAAVVTRSRDRGASFSRGHRGQRETILRRRAADREARRAKSARSAGDLDPGTMTSKAFIRVLFWHWRVHYTRASRRAGEPADAPAGANHERRSRRDLSLLRQPAPRRR